MKPHVRNGIILLHKCLFNQKTTIIGSSCYIYVCRIRMLCGRKGAHLRSDHRGFSTAIALFIASGWSTWKPLLAGFTWDGTTCVERNHFVTHVSVESERKITLWASMRQEEWQAWPVSGFLRRRASDFGPCRAHQCFLWKKVLHISPKWSEAHEIHTCSFLFFRKCNHMGLHLWCNFNCIRIIISASRQLATRFMWNPTYSQGSSPTTK